MEELIPIVIQAVSGMAGGGLVATLVKKAAMGVVPKLITGGLGGLIGGGAASGAGPLGGLLGGMTTGDAAGLVGGGALSGASGLVAGMLKK